MDKFYKDGIRFECQRCGNCCTCEGYVFIFKKDLMNLIDGAKLSKEDLQANYLSTYREYTVLRSRADNTCIFWDREKKGCSVYEHRPTQCRTYPFWNTLLKTEAKFEEEKDFCPGIDKGKLYTEEEIDKLRDLY